MVDNIIIPTASTFAPVIGAAGVFVKFFTPWSANNAMGVHLDSY